MDQATLFEKISSHMAQIYVDISNGEFVYIEFNNEEPEVAKALSLKAHSAMTRMLHQWEAGSFGVPTDADKSQN